MAETPEDGAALIDEIVKEPNLDYFYERNPVELTDEEVLQLVNKERSNRAMFIEKKSK